jgi:hypothetical protein
MDFRLLDRFGMVSELAQDILLYLTMVSRGVFVGMPQWWGLMEVSTHRSKLQHPLMQGRLRPHPWNT